MFDLPNQFRTYLRLNGASRSTIKNYLTDFNHFLAWLELTLRGQNIALNRSVPELIVHYFDPNYLTRYKNYLLQNQLPISTINRRLSTLRNFGGFCVSQAWLTENPAKQIKNITLEEAEGFYPELKKKRVKKENERFLIEFRKDLEKEKFKPNTIKNYLADIKNFLAWAEFAT